jgi:hypothetical protein
MVTANEGYEKFGLFILLESFRRLYGLNFPVRALPTAKQE